MKWADDKFYSSWHERCGDAAHPGGCYHLITEFTKCVAENVNEPKMAEESEMGIQEPASYIQQLAQELRDTLSSKNSDYAPAGEFSNFEIAAEFAGIEPFELILGQIAIKMTRIQNLHINQETGSNESLRDSLVDLAGYSVIAAAWLDAVQADAAKEWMNGIR